MYGLSGTAGLAATERLHLNTLFLATDTEVSVVEDNRHVAQEAQQAGVQVIIGLPTLCADRAADPEDPAYLAESGAQIRTVVRQFLPEPAVTAWAVGDYPERSLRYTDAGLQGFLQKRYVTLDALNDSWGSHFPDWADLTLSAARDADAARPYKVGRASVDGADYQADALRRLLAFWAQEVRKLDPRPLLTGRLGLYRSLVSVPPDYAYVVPAASGGGREGALDSQNAPAVDLARQGGAVEVIPCLRVPVPPEPAYASGATVRRRLQEAALHGARGVALDDADRIRQCPNPEGVLAQLADDMQTLAGAFSARPRNSLAVLYEPYAEGRQAGTVPAYGYIAGLATGEPSLLMEALGRGSNYGLVDYLTPERLAQTDLEGYSAILAPTALRFPAEVQGKLRGYVEGGGRLICDLGAGMYETGSWQSLPEDLARLCGVTGYGILQTQHADLTLSPPTALLPSLVPPLRSRGLPPEKLPPPPGTIQRSTSVGNPQEAQGWTIQGLVGYVSLSEEAKPIALVGVLAPKIPRPRGRLDPAAAAAALNEARAKTKFAGLVAQPSGAGWAGYCSATLWSHWDPSDPFFQGFLSDLWAPRAGSALRQPAAGATVEVSGEDQALHLFNTGAHAVLADVATLTEDNRLYAGAFAQVPDLAGRVTAPAVMIVTAELAPGQLVTLPRVPVALLPAGSGAVTYLRRYGPAGLSLLVAGPGARLTLDLRHQRDFTQGQPLSARVVIENGAYPVPPGSRHQVKIDAGFGHQTTAIVPADDQGRLSFTITGGKVQIEVAPAPPV
jgi:hypothetical protein